MMGAYQGKALGLRRPRPRAGWMRRVLRLSAALALAFGIQQLPWERLTDRFWVLGEARVEGYHYLDPDAILAIAGIEPGQSLFDLDRRAARQALQLHPRIEHAEVSRLWLRGVRVRVIERVPLLLVRHGQPWEMDSTGTLLEPLANGVVADAPLLAGASFANYPEGSCIATPEVRRAVAWARMLASPELQLVGQTSEIDVSEERTTSLLLLDGTRVMAPDWPLGVRDLSALRVVLADLKQRGTPAREVDLRFHDQLIVRPAHEAEGENVPMEAG